MILRYVAYHGLTAFVAASVGVGLSFGVTNLCRLYQYEQSHPAATVAWRPPEVRTL